VTFTPFPCPFSVLAIALFIYYTSVPAGTEAKKEVKYINKKCSLTRKGHGNGVTVASNIIIFKALLQALREKNRVSLKEY